MAWRYIYNLQTNKFVCYEFKDIWGFLVKYALYPVPTDLLQLLYSRSNQIEHIGMVY